MATISVSLPSDGSTADAADVNTPINTIVNEINGNLDNANIKSNAAISGSKLADASVSGSKLGSPYAPQGYLQNGKISRTVSSDNITVAIKTLAGTDPTSSDPVYVRIGDTVRSITSALSVTKNAGTNWFDSGSTDTATLEVDYFVYLGYNATDGVVIGFARIPNATTYGDFSATATNDRYCAISTTATAASTDEYEVVGRFNAILSATATFAWSVPATSLVINRPIFETRWLPWTITWAGVTATYTSVNRYRITGSTVELVSYRSTNQTSNGTGLTATIPLNAATVASLTWQGVTTGNVDNSAAVTTAGSATIASAASTAVLAKDAQPTGWTGSGTKGANFQITYQI